MVKNGIENNSEEFEYKRRVLNQGPHTKPTTGATKFDTISERVCILWVYLEDIFIFCIGTYNI